MTHVGSLNHDSEYYFDQVRAASLVDKPALFASFCHAAIAEREQGEMELYQVGNSAVILAGNIITTPVKLFPKNLTESERLLEELYRLGGQLDLAGQAGTTNEADEELWREFKDVVSRYESSLRDKYHD
jgi:hypothetical protein